MSHNGYSEKKIKSLDSNDIIWFSIRTLLGSYWNFHSSNRYSNHNGWWWQLLLRVKTPLTWSDCYLLMKFLSLSFPDTPATPPLGETLSLNDFILVCSNWYLFSVFIAPVFKKNNGISRKSKTLCCSNFIAMKWQCLGIRNHSNYPMIIISKRVYPITILCGNLFELRAPPSLENRG